MKNLVILDYKKIQNLIILIFIVTLLYFIKLLLSNKIQINLFISLIFLFFIHYFFSMYIFYLKRN